MLNSASQMIPSICMLVFLAPSVFSKYLLLFMAKGVQTCESQRRDHRHQTVFCVPARYSMSGSLMLFILPVVSFCRSSVKSSNIFFKKKVRKKSARLSLDSYSFVIHKSPLKSDIILCDKILLYFAYAFIFTLTPVCYTTASTFSPCFYSQSASQQEAQKV